MKNILKLVFLFVLICASCGVLIACNSGNDNSSIPTDEAPSDSNNVTQAPTQRPTDRPTARPTLADDPDSDLPFYLDLPEEINGKVFAEEGIDLGQNSYMNVSRSKTSVEDYETYLSDIEAEGFVKYTDNRIGDNLFATYITQTQIVNVMFLKEFTQVRVVVDDRYVFDLPGLKEENVFEGNEDTSLTLVSDDSVNWPGRMGYIYKLSDGSFVIIDGGATSWVPGCGSSADVIMNVLRKHADDPNNIRVAAWLITHIHEDHMGGFYDMSKSTRFTDKVTIEKLIYNQPSVADSEIQDVNTYTHDSLTEVCELMESAIEKWKPEQIIKAHPGQVFYLRDLTMTVYYSQELLMETVNQITTHNNVSIVTMVELEGKKALYLGDTVADANQRVIDPLYGDALKCDILQVAHHGYGDTGAQSVYTHADPSVVFWPVYAYHYFTSESYDGVKDLPINSVLFKDGTKHYIHDDKCTVIEDFNTMEGIEWDAMS